MRRASSRRRFAVVPSERRPLEEHFLCLPLIGDVHDAYRRRLGALRLAGFRSQLDRAAGGDRRFAIGYRGGRQAANPLDLLHGDVSELDASTTDDFDPAADARESVRATFGGAE